MHKIESGIPAPLGRVRDKGYTAALRALGDGDSVMLAGAAPGSVNALAWAVLGAGGYRLRVEGDGVRVWRVTVDIQ